MIVVEAAEVLCFVSLGMRCCLPLFLLLFNSDAMVFINATTKPNSIPFRHVIRIKRVCVYVRENRKVYFICEEIRKTRSQSHLILLEHVTYCTHIECTFRGKCTKSRMKKVIHAQCTTKTEKEREGEKETKHPIKTNTIAQRHTSIEKEIMGFPKFYVMNSVEIDATF